MSQYPDLYPAKDDDEEKNDSETNISDENNVQKALQESSAEGTSFVKTGTKS